MITATRLEGRGNAWISEVLFYEVNLTRTSFHKVHGTPVASEDFVKSHVANKLPKVPSMTSRTCHTYSTCVSYVRTHVLSTLWKDIIFIFFRAHSSKARILFSSFRCITVPTSLFLHPVLLLLLSRDPITPVLLDCL